ncbi:MAG: hypothetical protein RLZZ561_1525 [Pseudomonadota bacterium]
MRFLFLFCLSLIATAPVEAAWYRVETPRFIFYGTSAPALKASALRLERYDAYLRQRFKISAEMPSNKLSVYVLESRPLVVKVHGAKQPDVAEFYDANETGIIAVVGRSGDEEWQDVVLFHEYAHHLMLQYFPAAYPAWYTEGFAEFYSTTRFKGDKIQVGLPARHRAYQLLAESTVPITKLLSNAVYELKREEIGNFYGRAWLLTHYLNFAPERVGQMGTYLQLINDGRASLDAAQQAFGDIDVLHRDMQRYLTGNKISYMSSDFAGPVEIKPSVTALNPGFEATVMDRIRLRRGTRPDEREPIAQRLRAAAAKFGDDAEVWTLLAEAELDADHFDAAIAAADKALALSPNLSRALLWRGLGTMRQLEVAGNQSPTEWKAARSWIIRANRADTEDPMPLFENYRSFHRAGLAVPPIAIDGLAKATALVPQADRLRFAYANELARKGAFGDAARYLQPIAASPHGGPSARRVQQLVAALQRAAEAKSKEGAVDLEGLFRQAEDAPEEPAS